MGNNTQNLELFKTDMETDGEDLFDFDRDLNQNWDKLDERFGVRTITLLANGWEGVSAPYSQTISIEGIKETHSPHIALKANPDFDIAENELGEYSKLFKGETSDGAITFWAKEQTGIDIELQIKIL